MLGYLRHVAELSIDSADENALRALVEGAVPDLADEAVLFVMASDGLLRRAARARNNGEPPRHDPDLQEDAPIPRDSPHAAMVATRVGTLAYLEEGEGMPVLFTGQPLETEDSRNASIRAVAIPIMRDREAVGAFYLCSDGKRHYRTTDLELLLALGSGVSIALENNRLRREARAARRAKGDFLSVMSHELRTPLTAVVGYADLLEAGIPGPVNEGQAGHLVRIKDSAWELLELIDGILAYARYEGEEPELKVEVVRPSDLVDDAVRVFKGSLREKGLELEIEMGADLPSCRTDREQASRILIHLLSNAHKFTDKGVVRVSVRHDPGHVVFSVKDTGSGIPQRDMEHIFEPFWQGQKADTRTAGGTGMGLSLAKRLTDLLSGDLTVESRHGQGTTVRLALPREGPHPSFP